MTRTAARLSAVRLGLACGLALLAACDRQISSSSIDEAPTMQPSKELSTRCIGRYLIDLPADLVLTPQGGQQIDGVQLSVTPATAEEYKKALAHRTTALTAAEVSSNGMKYPALRKTTQLPAGPEGVMFDRAKLLGSGGRVTRVLEVLAWRDGHLIKAEIEAVDTTFPEDKDDVLLQTHTKTDVGEKSRVIMDVVSRTSGRTDFEVPTQQGVCIVGGFVRGAPTAGEAIGAVYQFAKIDNFSLRLESTSLSRGKNTILDRVEGNRRLLEEANGKIFRKTKRDVAGMNGYEVAYTVLSDENPEQGRVKVDEFVFELNSAEGSKHKPRLRVEVSNGSPPSNASEADNGSEPIADIAPLKPAPLATAAVESMWDKIIPTVRVRPNAF